MRSSGWIITITSVVLGLLLIYAIASDRFSSLFFFGTIFYILLFIGGYLYIINEYSRKVEQLKEEREEKGKFSYCWNKANMLLQKLEGGEPLEWRKGIRVESDMKHLFDGTQRKPFRSFYGNSHNGTPILIIYDVDNEDIVKYTPRPNPNELIDHFYHFNLYSSQRSGGDYSAMYGTKPYDRRYAPRHQPTSYPIGGFGPDPMNPEGYIDMSKATQLTPDKETVDAAFEKIKKKGN